MLQHPADPQRTMSAVVPTDERRDVAAGVLATELELARAEYNGVRLSPGVRGVSQHVA